MPPQENRQPWYKDGLRFTCTQCGDCCTGEPGFVWVSEDEIKALSARLGLSIADFEQRYIRQVGPRKSLIEVDNGDCVFLKDRKCTVYADRPRQCRTWPFWDSNIRTAQAWKETCRECPGAGTGDFYPLEKIREAAAVIRI
ncbi:MAG: YkgJ family cysteine cluster protein [Planctomycetia bacterium]|nr:YkgJ family cysteine cluster protein [Planctomycetia bacterium]